MTLNCSFHRQNHNPPSDDMLPFPGTPSSSWAMWKSRLKAIFEAADPRVCTAFWLFGTRIIIHHQYVWELPQLTGSRSGQQCPLRDHPLRCTRSRRARCSQRCRSSCRGHALFPDQVMRSLLHPPIAILGTRPSLFSSFGNRDAPCSIDTCLYRWRHHCNQDGRRRSCQLEQRRWGAELLGPHPLLRPFQSRELEQWNRRRRSCWCWIILFSYHDLWIECAKNPARICFVSHHHASQLLRSTTAITVEEQNCHCQGQRAQFRLKDSS